LTVDEWDTLTVDWTGSAGLRTAAGSTPPTMDFPVAVPQSPVHGRTVNAEQIIERRRVTAGECHFEFDVVHGWFPFWSATADSKT
jgi:hypothetical protein